MALQQESFHPFPSCNVSPAFFQTAKRASSASLLRLAFQLPTLRSKGRPKASWFFLSQLPCLGFNRSTNLPLQHHFRLLPQLATPASIPIFFHLFWAAIVSLGRHGPIVEPSISKLLHRLCNQGELPPSYILGGSHSHLPGSKHGHSCLTYL